ncbi:Constitutive coactivator of PPAR-gamma-like protein 1 [Pteropus alecto]|uniref:Constitutive coactivator of PPAR-gamma-like protein 1 n=1 Tax=Pteropus alecto TaxID=9402 RepID=L5KI87_PTEAL|nr:Constitutive coactivator of PPAR-gamma-like protein 1 [Pteropus alecto]
MEDKNCRMRAFLGCMRSDTPAMLNLPRMPTHLTVLCCVPRYMVQRHREWILHCQELDAFLAQAMSPKFYEPDQLQELKIENLDPGDIQLSALNEWRGHGSVCKQACGQPMPWEHCCPWMYSYGKLFQFKLLKEIQEKTPLMDLCESQAEQNAKTGPGLKTVVTEKPASQMNRSAGDARAPSHSESALNSNSKTGNTNPHLNALSTESACCGADALDVAVLKQE